MKTLIVTDQEQEWFEIADATVLTARRYLAEPESGRDDHARLLNLCRTGRYQGRGYYVSLLAEARGQRPLPEVKRIGDLRTTTRLAALATEIEPTAQQALPADGPDRFELDAYLGADPAKKRGELAKKVFDVLCVPLLRVLFRREGSSWRMEEVQAIGLADIPKQDRAFLLDTVGAFASEAAHTTPRRDANSKPRIAILWDANEPHKPSNEEAIQRMVKTAPLVGLDAEVLAPGDLERLPEFDALFNRASPEVHGPVYEFVRRAESMGLPVVDDPESILRCLNKVFMQELMDRHRIPTPKTLIVHRGNVDEIVPTLGLPCVLKLPDSGFGLDVLKIESEGELRKSAERFFKVSELFVAQEWLPSDFDWRVGIYDRRPLFVAKYYMAPGHWKVNKVVEGEKLEEGKTEAMAVGEAPEAVIALAVRAANLIGRGLYDLKQVKDRIYLIEVNCNPNLDAGNEDQVLGQALYREVLGVFARRIAERRSAA